MAFLEASGIVHCNVAASNILLISEEHMNTQKFPISNAAEKSTMALGEVLR